MYDNIRILPNLHIRACVTSSGKFKMANNNQNNENPFVSCKSKRSLLSLCSIVEHYINYKLPSHTFGEHERTQLNQVCVLLGICVKVQTQRLKSQVKSQTQQIF